MPTNLLFDVIFKGFSNPSLPKHPGKTNYADIKEVHLLLTEKNGINWEIPWCNIEHIPLARPSTKSMHPPRSHLMCPSTWPWKKGRLHIMNSVWRGTVNPPVLKGGEPNLKILQGSRHCPIESTSVCFQGHLPLTNEEFIHRIHSRYNPQYHHQLIFQLHLYLWNVNGGKWQAPPLDI